MLNPIAQVSSPYDKWFLKNHNIRQKFPIWLILTGKNALQNGLSGAYLGFKTCQIPMVQVSSLYNKWFLKNHNFRQKFPIWLILTGKNALKWLEWHVFRVQDMPYPMALFSSLYDKWFLKNQNFRRQVA